MSFTAQKFIVALDEFQGSLDSITDVNADEQ